MGNNQGSISLTMNEGLATIDANLGSFDVRTNGQGGDLQVGYNGPNDQIPTNPRDTTLNGTVKPPSEKFFDFNGSFQLGGCPRRGAADLHSLGRNVKIQTPSLPPVCLLPNAINCLANVLTM